MVSSDAGQNAARRKDRKSCCRQFQVWSRPAKLIVLGALISVAAGARVFGAAKWRTTPDGIRGRDRAYRTPRVEIEDDPDNELLENYFQEIYMLQSAPKQLEFGHVCENPRQWEQRYEKRDFESNRHQGKVRWSDEKGTHGEHYWDLNHS